MIYETYIRGFSSDSMVKNLPANRGDGGETGLITLGQEDFLEETMVTHSSILDWKLPWTEEPGGLQPTGWRRVGQDGRNLATGRPELSRHW